MALRPKLTVLVASASPEVIKRFAAARNTRLSSPVSESFGYLPVGDDRSAPSPHPSEPVGHSARHGLNRRSQRPPGQEIR